MKIPHFHFILFNLKIFVKRVFHLINIIIYLLFQAIINRLPSPLVADPNSYNRDAELKALLFDSNFEKHKGVVANVLVLNGTLRKGGKITSHFLQEQAEKGKKNNEVKEIGILKPNNHPLEALYAGS